MQKMRLAFLILLALLLAACSADTERTDSTEFRVACFGCEQAFGSGQLNTDFGLCQDCMIRVGAAYCQNCTAPCYTRDMVYGLCQACSADIEETDAIPETTAAPESEPAPSPETEYVGRCDTCGQPYKDGEGFESLCYDCQDKYGPKCSVCGTDCTYRGTIDGMCDDCWDAAQGIPEYVGTCDTCGQPYKGGEGFESLCYICQDKYGPKCSVCGTDCTYRGTIDGMCDDCYEASRMCVVCGLTPGDYDGYCYYCHPNFGYTCSGCGMDQPEHRPESGLCWQCREKN